MLITLFALFSLANSVILKSFAHEVGCTRCGVHCVDCRGLRSLDDLFLALGTEAHGGTRLLKLVVRDSSLGGLRADSLPKLYSLRTLLLERCGLGESGIHEGAFAGVPSLTRLSLAGNALREFNALYLAQALPRLEELELAGNLLSELPLARNTTMPSLTVLSLHRNRLRMLDSATLAVAPALRELDVGFNALRRVHSGSSTTTRSPHRFLQTLQLGGNTELGVAHGSGKALAAALGKFFPSLQTLGVSQTSLGPMGVGGALLEQLPALRSLDLSGNAIDGSELVFGPPAAGRPCALERVDLSANSIHVLAREWLHALCRPSLRVLDLRANGIAAIACGALEGVRLDAFHLSERAL